MKHNTITVITVVVSLIVLSCQKQPEACFKADKTKADIGQTVKFTSCSENAKIIEWDFGDGSTAEGETASHSWNAPGSYIVQMKVLSKNQKKVDRFSSVITIKGYTRYLSKIVLKEFPEKKQDSSNWDNSFGQNPEPDVFVRLKLEAGGWQFDTPVKTDIKAADLPYTWNLTQENLYLSNQNWIIELRDDDSFGSTFATELMSSWTKNPANSGGNGIISLTATGYSVELHYDNRE
jgi:hypothetical protein